MIAFEGGIYNMEGPTFDFSHNFNPSVAPVNTVRRAISFSYGKLFAIRKSDWTFK